MKGLSFDETACDTFVTDIDSQNLKDAKNRIKNFYGVQSSINADTFKIGLSKYPDFKMPAFEQFNRCISIVVNDTGGVTIVFCYPRFRVDILLDHRPGGR